MSNTPHPVPELHPTTQAGEITRFIPGELEDLCDATEAAIKEGGGFGWVTIPERPALERYYQGILAMPLRHLCIARLDDVIAGAAQLVRPPLNYEAHSLVAQLTASFIAPWARGHGLATLLLKEVEKLARKEGIAVLNLDVRETQQAAIKFYEKNGFECIGTHPYYATIQGEVIQGRYYYKVINPDLLANRERP